MLVKAMEVQTHDQSPAWLPADLVPSISSQGAGG